MILDWEPRLARTVDNGKHSRLRQGRVGVMLHYDASTTDEGSVAWFADPRCRVSYQILVLDSGDYVRIAPDDRRAWHAGACKPSDPARLPYQDANSAFYGVAAATNDRVDVMPLQLLTVAWWVRRWFEVEGWPVTDLHRVTGHEHEAMPRGRKSDPRGADKDNPIFSVEDVRQVLGVLVP